MCVLEEREGVAGGVSVGECGSGGGGACSGTFAPGWVGGWAVGGGSDGAVSFGYGGRAECVGGEW